MRTLARTATRQADLIFIILSSGGNLALVGREEPLSFCQGCGSCTEASALNRLCTVVDLGSVEGRDGEVSRAALSFDEAESVRCLHLVELAQTEQLSCRNAFFAARSRCLLIVALSDVLLAPKDRRR